ncbi:hypothetical protein EU874_24500, partial [Salmonella enterica subsp. enterica serovar Teko]|nr:hypothetical protein [Salmonella enterica subsp. enterica serovar Teko]
MLHLLQRYIQRRQRREKLLQRYDQSHHQMQILLQLKNAMDSRHAPQIHTVFVSGLIFSYIILL